MSRGRGGAAGAGASRGGWGGSRGGGASSKQRIGGQEVSWDYDPDLVVETKPQEMFPRISLPQQRPPTTHELLALHHTLTLRRRIRTGPLYTTPSNHPTSLRLSKARAAADFNPFEDMPTYTQKYHIGVRKLPGFRETGRRYQLRFFPGELWETLEPGSGKHLKPVVPKGGKAGVDGRTPTGPGGKATSAADGTTSRPAMMPPSSSANPSAQARDSAAADEDGEDPTTAGAEENNAADADDEEEEANEEENLEEDFSEDDSDMGGDYNAENYFDAGEDDVDLGDDDGGGGGGMDYD